MAWPAQNRLHHDEKDGPCGRLFFARKIAIQAIYRHPDLEMGKKVLKKKNFKNFISNRHSVFGYPPEF